MTRNLRRLQEVEPEESETTEISKFLEEPLVPLVQPSLIHKDDRNKAVGTQEEECSFEEVKKKLKSANFEIAQLKKRARKHAIEKSNFKRVKSICKDVKVPRHELVDSHAQYFTWTIPAIKKERYIKRINGKLRTKIGMMKR